MDYLSCGSHYSFPKWAMSAGLLSPHSSSKLSAAMITKKWHAFGQKMTYVAIVVVAPLQSSLLLRFHHRFSNLFLYCPDIHSLSLSLSPFPHDVDSPCFCARTSLHWMVLDSSQQRRTNNFSRCIRWIKIRYTDAALLIMHALVHMLFIYENTASTMADAKVMCDVEQKWLEHIHKNGIGRICAHRVAFVSIGRNSCFPVSSCARCGPSIAEDAIR